MATSTIKSETHLVQRGNYGFSSSVTTTEVTEYVTFPIPYSTTPTVVVSLYGSSYNRRIHVNAVSQYGFSVTAALLSGTSSATVGLSWIATD